MSAGIGIVELIVLGMLALAAVAIAYHKPAVLLWGAGLLLLCLVTGVGLAFVSYYHVSRSTDWSLSSDPSAGIQWSGDTSNLKVATQAGPSGQITFNTQPPPMWAWGRIWLFALVAGGVLLAVLMMRSPTNVRRTADGQEAWHDNRRRGGRGWLLATFAVVAVLGLFLMRVNAPVAMHRTAEQLTDNARRQMENARQQSRILQQQASQQAQILDQQARQQAQVLKQQAIQQSQVIQQGAQRGIHELMNEYDKPRIPLTGPTAEKRLSYDEAKTLIEGDQGRAEATTEKQKEPPTKPTATHEETPQEEHGEAASGSGEPGRTAAGSEESHVATPSQPDSDAIKVENVAPASVEKSVTAAAATSPVEVPPAEAKQTPILKIHFSDSEMRGQGVSFAQVAAAFLRYCRDHNKPPRIDGEKRLIEIDANSELASQFSEMKLDARVQGGPSLSKFADSITTTGSPSVTTSSSGPRPGWVDEPLRRAGNATRQVVVSGDYSTVEECYRQADEQLFVATWNRLTMLIGHVPNAAAAASAPPGSEAYQPTYRSVMERMGITIDFIRRELVPAPRGDEYGEYLETVQTRSVGPMQRLYTLVEFTPGVDAQLRSMWVQSVQGNRLQAVINGSSVILALVGLIYGLLKVDTWTKGYYSKRLFLGVPAVIVAIVYLLVAANH